jgi:hypothetical protein
LVTFGIIVTLVIRGIDIVNQVRLMIVLALALAASPIPQAFSAPGVQSWNRNCIRFYNEWKKKRNHKAFAVSTWQSSQSCGGAWGARSKKAAEEGARKWCKKYSTEGGSCRVTASE